MTDDLFPGELVVHRVRWYIDSSLVGIVVSHDGKMAHVLWCRHLGEFKLGFHFCVALTSVSDTKMRSGIHV